MDFIEVPEKNANSWEFSPLTKQLCNISAKIFTIYFQWGFVPTIIYLGFKRGADPLPNGEVPLCGRVVCVLNFLFQLHGSIPCHSKLRFFTILSPFILYDNFIHFLKMLEELRKRGSEFSSIFSLYHLMNILLSAAFPLTKSIPKVSELLFGMEQRNLDTREREILIFLAVVVIWKCRRASSYLHTLSTAYLYSKLANALLFFRVKPLFGLFYCAIAVGLYVLVDEPLPPDSEKVRFFSGEELRNTLQEDKSIVWIIEFFATWSPECRYVRPVFNALSEKFTLPNLRFGKLDVGRFPKEAEYFRINCSATSRQLPTFSYFKGGIQTERRPLIGSNGNAVPFVFTEQNIILALDLTNHNSQYFEIA
ncbi:Thioredoxin domain-containing protein [Meloidogyne graminicola]|uniref:Thioredoxin domain-containing protein n=1 Tax=Meloidogyne graminicola TaxID=189291 RepID=A0A8T0A3M0_9BILA|nr:Thioredoxin domain-containing protein [Meloidogyne graminicola]